MNQYRMTDEHLNIGTTAGITIVLTWVFMAIHVEEATDRGQRGDPGSSPAWEEMSNPFST
jgi:hypothetical protein